MEVKAYARNIRIAPRKVRLVIGLVRGMDVEKAAAQLKFIRKASALPVLKLLNSAIANAEHNFKLDSGDLYIKTITADGGPMMKRWRSRAFGRAAPIRKRTSHISIVLSEKPKEGKAAAAAVVKTAEARGKKPEAKAKETKPAAVKEAKKPAVKAEPKAASKTKAS